MSAPVWFDATVTRECERCPDVVRAGEPAAWLPATDETCCYECGDQAEAALPPAARFGDPS